MLFPAKNFKNLISALSRRIISLCQNISETFAIRKMRKGRNVVSFRNITS